MDSPEPEAFHPVAWTPNRICLEPTRKRRFRQARKFRSVSTRRIRCAPQRRRCFLMRGSPVESVQDPLDRKHITTTQIYDKRRQSVERFCFAQGADLTRFLADSVKGFKQQTLQDVDLVPEHPNAITVQLNAVYEVMN
jgi:hypothetical protein